MRTNTPAAAPTRRGTVEIVISCREVRTCTTFTTKLIAMAMASIGPPIWKTSSSVRCPSSTTPMASSSKTFHQRTDQQMPAVDHHEQKQFQRRGDHHRGQLQHADGGGDGGHDHVDHEKRKKQHRADLKT